MTDTQRDAFTLELDLHHPPEKVWRALTRPELLRQWLLDTDFFPQQTGRTFTFQAQRQPGWDGVVSCELLAIEPHRALSYSWKAAGLNTRIDITLTPFPGGCRIRLTQSGFSSDQRRAFGGAKAGWGAMLGRLDGVLGAI